MIFDDVLSRDNKIIIAVLSAGIWIYFRTAHCYDMIPRMHLLPVVFVMVWAYINYHEPLALPFGLIILAGFPIISKLFWEEVRSEAISEAEERRTSMILRRNDA